jgi:hypothetical protein
VVDDLAAATAFFVELGLELEGEASVEGDWVDRVVGLEGVRSDIAMLETPDGQTRIELSQFRSPPAPDGDPQASRTHPASATSPSRSTTSTLPSTPTAPSSSARSNATRTSTSSVTSAARRGSPWSGRADRLLGAALRSKLGHAGGPPAAADARGGRRRRWSG